MSIRRWIANAVGVKQVVTVTPANVETGDQFILTVNGKSITVAAAEATVANVVALLVAAWNASTIPEFAEITATDTGTHVTLIADTAGKPFTVSASTQNTGAGNISIVETTPGREPTNEVQKVELIGTYSGGTFTLSIDLGAGTETTGNIAHNATAGDVQSALVGLASIDPADVLVTGAAGGPWFVQWQGQYAETDIDPLVIDGTNLTGNGDVVISTVAQGSGAADEIQSITFTGATTGNYRLNFNGQQTANLGYNANAVAVQAALESLASIGSGNVAVYGGKATHSSNIRTHYVVFTGTLGGQNVSQISVTNSTSGSAAVGTVRSGGGGTANEYQLVYLGEATGGTFELSYEGTFAAGGAYDEGTFNLQASLQGSLGSGNVLVTGVAGLYLVEFTGALADTDVAELVLNDSGLSGTGGIFADPPGVSTLAAGSANTSEVQSVYVAATGGTFTLDFDGQVTAATAWNASAATIKARLEALANITTVSVTGTGTPVDPWLVTFSDPTDNVAELAGDGTSLTGGGGISTEVTAAVTAVNEVQTVTLATGINGGTFSLSYGGTATSGIAWNADAATVEATLEALATIGSGNVAVSGSAGGPWSVEFTGLLAATDVALLTGDGASLTGGAGDETLTVSTTTAATGPHHWDNAANWSGGAVPVNGDDVVFDSGNVPCLYALPQSAVTLASLTVTMGYTGRIGLPEITEGAGYREYRDQYLSIGATLITIGQGSGGGSGRIKLDSGSAQTTLNIYGTGQPIDAGIPAVLWKGTHAANAVHINRGSLGIATRAGELATVDVLKVGYQSNPTGDASVDCGAGLTLTTLQMSGGDVTLRSDVTTASMTDGELTFESGSLGTLNLDGGKMVYKSTGTLTTVVIGSEAWLDFSQDMRLRTVTNCTVNEQGRITDKFKTVTWTNGIDLNRTGLDGVELDLGEHLTVTPSAV